MKSLTIQFVDRADAQPGFDVVLRDGDPAENGQELERVSLPPLTAAQTTSLGALREAMLNQTGKIARLEERMKDVGDVLLPSVVRTRWLALSNAISAELAEWGRDRDTILADPQETPARKAWAQVQPGYRTYVEIGVADLDWIPWEFARVDVDRLFLLGDAPFSRYRLMQGPRVIPKPGWQIRVLVLMAARDSAAIDADAELREIRTVLRRLDRIYDIDVIRTPTRAMLTAQLKKFKPHVLHFIGHGSGDALQIYDGANNQPWGAAQIAADIGPGSWIPEVVYLNACRTYDAGGTIAAPAVADQDRQRTIVEALLGRQVLAVVAMQADVRGSAAGACAAAFYESMLDGSPIDIACANGRAAISRMEGRDGARDPYLPVLTLTVPADNVLRHRTSVIDPAAPMISESLAEFVDRFPERREITEAFEVATRKHVVVLRGSQYVGKSWLLCWSIDLCLRRNYHVRYLKLSECTDWLHVLRSLRDGNDRRPKIQDPLGDLLAPSFNWKLSQLARGKVELSGTPAAMEPDTAGLLAQIEADPLKPPNFGPLTFAAFHEALRCTHQQPLVLVFDQIEAGDAGFGSPQFALLRDHWIDPLIARGDGKVRALLAVRSERQYDYKLETLPMLYARSDVGQFAAQDSIELLRELFCLRLLQHPSGSPLDRAAMRAQMEEELAEYGEEACTGAELRGYLDGLWNTCLRKLKKPRGPRA